MADKKISDLTLRSNVNDDVQVPIDDGVQTYRTTAPQWKNYIYGSQRSPIDAMNYSIAAAVASSNLTISLKDFAGSNGQTSSPIGIVFRNVTIGSGLPFLRQVTAALSTVLNSGSTAGHQDGIDAYLYLYAIDNAGTLELAWSALHGWDENVLQSTTAEGGGTATDGETLYSTTARSNVPIRYLGRMKSNQATAGVWASAMLEISSFPIVEYKKQKTQLSNTTGSGWGAGTSFSPILDLSSNPLEVTVRTNGEDVEIGMQDDGSGNTAHLESYCVATTNSWVGVEVAFFRDGVQISAQGSMAGANSAFNHIYASPGSFKFVDTNVPPGDHVYSVQSLARTYDGGGINSGLVIYTCLYARPL